MIGMEFLDPERLWWLLAVLALGIAYVAVQRWRRRATVRFTQVDLLDRVAPSRPGLAPPRRRRHPAARPGRRRRGHRPTDLDDDGAHGERGPHPRAVRRVAVDDGDRRRPDPPRGGEGGGPRVRRPGRRGRRGRADLLQRQRRRRGASRRSTGRRSTEGSRSSSWPSRRPSATPWPPAPTCSRSSPRTPTRSNDEGATADDDELAPGAMVLLTDGETTVGRPTEVGGAGGRRRRRPGVHDRLRHARRVDHRSGERRGRARPGAAGAARSRSPRSPAARPTRRRPAPSSPTPTSVIRDSLGDTLGEEIEIVTELTWRWAAAALVLLAAAWALALWWLRGMV